MRRILIITVCWPSLSGVFYILMVGIKGFQYWPTDWFGLSFFGDSRAGVICFGQNFIRISPGFLISPIFPLDFGEVRPCKLSKCTSSHQARLTLSLLGFITLLAGMITSNAEVATFQGGIQWSIVFTTPLSLNKQLAVSWGQRYPMNLIYSSHRGLLKFLSGICHRWSMCSSGDFNPYRIVMTNREEHVLAVFYLQLLLQHHKTKTGATEPCKGRFATHSYTKSKHLFKGC